MNLPALAAAALAAFCAGLHLVIGGRESARPLLAADTLKEVPRETLYFAWHLVTVTLVVMAIAFAAAALRADLAPLLWMATALAAGFTVTGVAINVVRRLRPMVLPQWILFAPMTALGLAAAL